MSKNLDKYCAIICPADWPTDRAFPNFIQTSIVIMSQYIQIMTHRLLLEGFFLQNLLAECPQCLSNYLIDFMITFKLRIIFWIVSHQESRQCGRFKASHFPRDTIQIAPASHQAHKKGRPNSYHKYNQPTSQLELAPKAVAYQPNYFVVVTGIVKVYVARYSISATNISDICKEMFEIRAILCPWALKWFHTTC